MLNVNPSEWRWLNADATGTLLLPNDIYGVDTKTNHFGRNEAQHTLYRRRFGVEMLNTDCLRTHRHLSPMATTPSNEQMNKTGEEGRSSS